MSAVIKYQKHLSEVFINKLKMACDMADKILPERELMLRVVDCFDLIYYFREFYFGFIKKLEKKYGNTDEVRIIFFFDN